MDKLRCAPVLLLLILLAMFSHADGQFKIVDSAHFRTKKGVSRNSSSIAFVQINHYMDPAAAAEQSSRAFSIQQGADEANLIKVHIEYQKKNAIHPAAPKAPSETAAAGLRSNLHRIIANNKNQNKYTPIVRRQFKNRPQMIGRKDVVRAESPIQRALIMQENQRILKKLKVQSDYKKRPTKVSTFRSNCRCVAIGNKCPKMQITVARCNSNEMLCCF